MEFDHFDDHAVACCQDGREERNTAYWRLAYWAAYRLHKHATSTQSGFRRSVDWLAFKSLRRECADRGVRKSMPSE